MDKKVEIVSNTKLWIKRFVIALSLCPFAKYSFDADAIQYEVSEEEIIRECLGDVVKLIVNLSKSEKEVLSNGFTIFEKDLSFDFMLDLKSVVDSFLEDSEMSADFQTVVFHSQFQFAGESENAHSNFTNRSPYPMIHVLRVDEVADAIESHDDIESIPIRNATILNKLALIDVSEVFESKFENRVSEVLKATES